MHRDHETRQARQIWASSSRTGRTRHCVPTCNGQLLREVSSRRVTDDEHGMPHGCLASSIERPRSITFKVEAKSDSGMLAQSSLHGQILHGALIKNVGMVGRLDRRTTCQLKLKSDNYVCRHSQSWNPFSAFWQSFILSVGYNVSILLVCFWRLSGI